MIGIKRPKVEHVFFIMAMVSLGLLLAAIAIENIYHLEPCPLCVLQRIVYFIFGLLCLIAALHRPRARGLAAYTSLVVFFGGIGIAIAARHVYLEHLPAHAKPACGPSLDYLVANVPLLDALKVVLAGSADCATVTWRLLHWSLAQWSLLLFVILTLCAMTQFFHKNHHHR